MTIITTQASHRLYGQIPSHPWRGECATGLYVALHRAADVMTKQALGHVVQDRLGDFVNLSARTEQERMLPHGGYGNVLPRSAIAPGVNTGISG